MIVRIIEVFLVSIFGLIGLLLFIAFPVIEDIESMTELPCKDKHPPVHQKTLPPCNYGGNAKQRRSARRISERRAQKLGNA